MPPNPFPASAMSFDLSSSPSQMAWVHPNEFHVLNATQSKTRNLPSELLSTIFQHACSTFDEESIINFHLVLRLVSTLWYDISQSTPQLWASVFLPPLRTDNAHIKGKYLGLCLRNSGSLPLTLELRFYDELRGVGWGWFVSPNVDTALEQNAHRI
ncbi:hypothetical protein AGABI2DRAFT_119017 [Agaricus bisporus var. bisporus H97]|uniref:hypothetical protein n=1 Tax=Agaricus bisporus var. bisporus (strain H97 / ATCC MYA-4626 / FGSC 10389) TaxID=936046 RepID=UPI00029F6DF3|nr:hypothetical protein AGABI2DRAFT_119017 [Agaricus bisporus var. bisporus H97]EKV46835.1 hypothetical protein AGABI2DRAFT_119017 [Agaricus bisporus var. bisporus H97]